MEQTAPSPSLTKLRYGIPGESISWNPAVNPPTCIGCPTQRRFRRPSPGPKYSNRGRATYFPVQMEA
jgi:hypothetical protein